MNNEWSSMYMLNRLSCASAVLMTGGLSCACRLRFEIFPAPSLPFHSCAHMASSSYIAEETSDLWKSVYCFQRSSVDFWHSRDSDVVSGSGNNQLYIDAISTFVFPCICSKSENHGCELCDLLKTVYRLIDAHKWCFDTRFKLCLLYLEMINKTIFN